MKKKLLYGLMGLLFALSLVGFVACDDDDDDGDSGDTTNTTLTEVTSGTYKGYYSLDDVSDIELSSDSLTLLLSTTRLSRAEEVVIVFTTDSTNYADAWLAVCYSDWTYVILAFVGEQSSADTYTFVIDSTGGACSGETNGEVTVYYMDSSAELTDTANTISTYTSGGIYTTGANCTLSAVYVKYSE